MNAGKVAALSPSEGGASHPCSQDPRTQALGPTPQATPSTQGLAPTPQVLTPAPLADAPLPTCTSQEPSQLISSSNTQQWSCPRTPTPTNPQPPAQGGCWSQWPQGLRSPAVQQPLSGCLLSRGNMSSLSWLPRPLSTPTSHLCPTSSQPGAAPTPCPPYDTGSQSGVPSLLAPPRANQAAFIREPSALPPATLQGASCPHNSNAPQAPGEVGAVKVKEPVLLPSQQGSMGPQNRCLGHEQAWGPPSAMSTPLCQVMGWGQLGLLCVLAVSH